MEMLLVNTPIFSAKRDPKSEDSVPPIGMGYIYTQVTRSGIACRFVDAVVDRLLPEEIVEIINKADAECVGLNVFSSNLGIVRQIVESVECPKRFLLGGPAVRSLIPEIENWSAKGSVTVVAGESELILPEIIRHRTPADLDSRTKKVVTVTPESRFFPSNIDLPLDRSIFQNEPIRRQDLGLIESHIIASRGCLYNCAFCTAAISLNPGIGARYRTFESLAEEIESIRRLHPETDCIRVLDDLFLRDRASIELAIKLFRQYNLRWRSMAHINTFRDLPASWLDGIRHAGCRELFIGIESGNDETLRHIRKPFSAAVAYKTVSRILDAQIPVKCYFVLGFPDESESAMKDTLNLASRLQDYARRVGAQLRISPFRFRPYHGTALYEELVKKGRAIAPIVNRMDISDNGEFNPYDCVSGVYADCDEKTLNKNMKELKKLSASG